MARTITIVIYENLSDEQYADFGNGIWSVLKMALPGDAFHLKGDGGTSTGFLNGRWAQHGDDFRWR